MMLPFFGRQPIQLWSFCRILAECGCQPMRYDARVFSRHLEPFEVGLLLGPITRTKPAALVNTRAVRKGQGHSLVGLEENGPARSYKAIKRGQKKPSLKFLVAAPRRLPGERAEFLCDEPRAQQVPAIPFTTHALLVRETGLEGYGQQASHSISGQIMKRVVRRKCTEGIGERINRFWPEPASVRARVE